VRPRGNVMQNRRRWHTRRFTNSLVAAAALLVAAIPADAAILTIGLNVSPSSMDPHFHYVGQNTGPLSHVFESLVAQLPDFSLGPRLATSWHAVDDTTWEFRLRAGVKFHDGSDFTAEDAQFSLHRVPLVPNSPNSFALYTKNIESVTIVNPLTLRIRTKTADPEFPVSMSQILIMSRTGGNGAAPEGRTTQELNAGHGMIGTGPYRFAEFVSGDRMIVTANPTYWGDAPTWERVVMKIMTVDASRTAAMLSGDLDATELPGESLAPLKEDPKFRVTLGASCLISYLALDQHDHSPKVTDAGGKNPLQDPRVRAALSHAINRGAIAERIMSGMAEPAAELGPPTLFGAMPDTRPDQYDPDKAKQLLAEAGYAGGFSLTLESPSGLFPRDTDMAQAIAAMWTRVGVRTAVEGLPGTIFYSRRNQLQYSAYVTNMCAYNGQLSYSLRILAMTQDIPKGNGGINYSGYADAEVDRLISESLRTLNDDARRALVHQASEIVMHRDHAVLSIIRLRTGYVSRKSLVVVPRLDNWLTAMQVRPAP
jgi:peptide/nickel transport system substrate-binding protein